MTTPTQNPSRDDRFEAVLADYLRRTDAGESIDRLAIVAEHPDLAADLESFFRNRDALERIAEPLRVGSGSGSADEATLGLGDAAEASGRLVRYFGDYELLSEIARGGMGVVYKARQRSLNRPVALKMILSGQLASSIDVERFRQEAEHAANLDHPNIVPIYEIGVHDGRHYFSMRLVEGSNLRAELPRLRTDTPAAVRLLVDVARAVHHAHQRGVLHRDIKPGNILIDRDGAPHVTDFGLARKVEGESDLTQSGAIVGTPSYMAPEQAQGQKQLSTAVDVYSLGAVLYELLTGKPPFRAATPMETLVQLLSRDPERPSLSLPSVDRDLETIALKCLERDPARRYDSAAALADDFDRWLRGEPILARRISRGERAARWCKRNPAVAGLAAAAVLALVLGTFISTFFGIRAAREASAAREAQQAAEAHAEDARRSREQSEADAAAAVASAAAADTEKQRADRKATDAENARSVAEFERRQADRHLYDARLNLAQRDWESHNVRGMLRHLEAAGPADGIERAAGLLGLRGPARARTDLRGFEWHYWQRRYHSELLNLHALFVPRAHPSGARAVAYSPDGAEIATCGDDRLVRLWNAADGRPIRTFGRHDDYVSGAAFSADGTLLASAGGLEGVKVWNVADGKLRRTFVVRTGDAISRAMRAAFSPDGRRLAVASADGNVRLWDLETGTELAPLAGHRGTVYGVAYRPDGLQIASAGQDGSVRIWDVATGRELRILAGHVGEAADVKFSPDGKHLASAGWDRTVRLWNADDGRPIATFDDHDDLVICLDFSPDGRRLASAGNDKVVRIREVAAAQAKDAREPLVIQAGESAVFGLAFSPDGGRLATADLDGDVKIWDAQRGQEPPAIDDDLGGSLRAVVYSPDGRWFAAAGSRSRVNVYDAERKRVHQLEGHVGSVNGLVFTPDSRTIVSAGHDQSIRFWNLTTGKQERLLEGHTQPVNALAFSRDGKWLASGAGSLFPSREADPAPAEVKLWDVTTAREIRTFVGPQVGVTAVSFSPDGTRLATACPQESSVTLWDTTTGKPLDTLKGHGNLVTRVVFSPDGLRLATCSYDGTARLWEPASGRETAALVGHAQQVSDVVFSPDGRRLATASQDQTVKLWDLETAQETLTLAGHAGAVSAVAFSPDGKLLISVGRDGRARVWDATPQE